MTRGELKGLRAAVTGSTRGLGLAFATELARHGASIVVNGTTAESTDHTVSRLRNAGARVVGVAGSVAELDTAEAITQAAVDEFGGIDLLVNNAGVTADRSLLKMTADEFDRVIAVHLRGTWACSAAAGRAMRATGGSIINVTSGSGLFGMFGQSNYASAKAGIVGLTRVMHLELARHDIRVNALAPVAATDMTSVFSGDAGVSHGVEFPPAETVAPIVAYLAHPSAAHIRGQVLSFDGTTLSVWTHPAPAHTVNQAKWDLAAFAEAIPDSALQSFNPDNWGSGVSVT